MRKARTLAAAIAALLTIGACQDNAPPLPLVEALEEGDTQQADHAEAYARAQALGCTFLDGGAVRCPELWALNNATFFPSVDAIPPPRKPQRLEERSPAEQDLVEEMRAAFADPSLKPHFTEHTWDLALYFVENIEAEDAMARAGCDSMEDDCSNRIRSALGWRGMGSPTTAGMEEYWAEKAETTEETKVRQK